MVVVDVMVSELLSVLPHEQSMRDKANASKIVVFSFKSIILPSIKCLFDLSLMRKVELVSIILSQLH